ncbi:MAG TPA: ABC transporter ATP-binding protein [Acetobacteraceae bacterium]|jgi:putative spermidine/putrescine transport system ATP-binding protein|nr:ABC transporter ATP-binding protein [Acetobacteraceae bacterium]
MNITAIVARDPAQATQRRGHRVEVDQVWKSYTPGTHVVRDVSFSLAPGEFLTLLGPSGSGKTSTLMMVAGFEDPDRGAIRVDGRDVAGLPPERRNFGVVFQGYALFPHMSVLDNVAFPLRMKRIGAATRRRAALEMLEKVGLADFAARRPRALSGGQQQRVALARALVFEPDALLLDEPLGALDRQLREALQIEIKQIQRRVGVSILFVTHDQDEAMMMSDRIAVMDQGQIAQLGTPDQVYLHPETPFVASFLGETNLLRGVCVAPEEGYATVRFAGAHGWARISRGRARPNDGDAVRVSLRPERIALLGANDHADCAVTGVLTDRVFLGRHTRLVVQALGQSVVVSTAALLAGSLDVGASVRLGWSREDAQILHET